MPQVAYYRETQLTGDDAISHLKAIKADAIKGLGHDHVRIQYLTEWIKDLAENGGTVPCFERVKVEVKDLHDALELVHNYGFVRFAIGGRQTLEELVTERKRAGRTDWYC